MKDVEQLPAGACVFSQTVGISRRQCTFCRHSSAEFAPAFDGTVYGRAQAEELEAALSKRERKAVRCLPGAVLLRASTHGSASSSLLCDGVFVFQAGRSKRVRRWMRHGVISARQPREEQRSAAAGRAHRSCVARP